MTFQQAVQSTPVIADAYRAGLQALKERDRSCISARNPRSLTGSIDLDTALQNVFPGATRWDYGVGYSDRTEKVFWIEIHPASSEHINGMLNKLNWLQRWLNDNSPNLNGIPREFIWISSGKVSFQPGSPQRKKIAATGLKFAGEHFTIPH